MANWMLLGRVKNSKGPASSACSNGIGGAVISWPDPREASGSYIYLNGSG